MPKTHVILLLSDDPQRRAAWTRTLEKLAQIGTDPSRMQGTLADGPELIVTDKLPIAVPLGALSTAVSTGEVAVVGIGAQGSGDVVLPADCTSRELRLACQLMIEVVHLRRHLAEERRARQALRGMVYRDPLTGLANRRKWDQELAARLETLARDAASSGLGVVLLDLDLFKNLNDQLGHVAGDTALQRMAQKLAANVVPPHLAARLGGDEFGVLLFGILPDDVRDVAERVRRSVEHPVEEVTAAVGPVTASAGVVVVMPTDRFPPLDVLRAADRALHAAKQQGRNRTVTGSLHE